MEKLYILIFLAGKLVGTIGPLPYGMDECLDRVAETMTAINDERPSNPRQVSMTCEYRQSRPVLDDGTEGVRP